MEQTIPPAESSIVEFKREWTETARETFCAFLNSHGGRVYFGVSDDSSIVGIDKPDEISRTVLRFLNLRFILLPKVMFRLKL